MTRTAQALDTVAQPLRARRIAAWSAAALGLVAFLLGAVAWLARLDFWSTPAWVVISWTLAAVLIAVIGWAARGGLAHFTVPGMARWLETSGSWRLGSLRAVLEPSQQGTSPELSDLADDASARAVTEAGPVALQPLVNRTGNELRLGLGLLVLGGLALASSRPMSGSAALLFQPLKAWRAAIAPVRITASADTVDRGGSVTLTANSYGRRDATLWLRAPGEAWRPVELALDEDGVGSHELSNLETDIFARVTSGDRESDTVQVHVRVPVFLGSIAVTARYPAYLRMEDEPLPLTGDTLLLPAGTRLEATGEATAALASASWAMDSSTYTLDVDGKVFTGSFEPRRSGTYRLVVGTATGAPVAGDPVVLPVKVLPDSAPVLEIPVPGADTTAAADRVATIVIDARDDHGIRAVALELRRVSRLGTAQPVRDEPIILPEGTSDRAIMSVQLDPRQLGLVAGDTLYYRARATDNAPAAHVGRSREYVLRILTLAELRTEQRESASSIQAQLDSLAAESRKLERQTEDLARSQPRDASKQGRSAENLSFEQARKAEAVAQSQEDLIRQGEEVQKQLDELQKSAEAAGVADSAFQARLDEVRKQLEQALSPELRDKLQELRDALKELNAERTQEALKDLAQKQEALREALERSRELFKRAAMEGELKNLSEESKDLAKEQKQWNEQVAAADSQRAAALEQQMSQRADSLASALQQLSKQVGENERGDKLEQAAQQASKASQQMKQAAKSAQQGKKQQAKEQGQQAQEQLEPLGDELEQQREDMAQEWRNEVVEQLDRALADVSRLGERQLEVTRGFERGDPASKLRSEQAAIEEGVQRLQEQLREAGGKNALVSPQISTALAAAQRQMQKARDAVGSANPNPREGGDRAGEALDALNAAAHGLLRTRGDVSGAQSGSGMAEAMERMAQMAQQQGQIGEQGMSLLPQMGAQGAQQQLAQLAAQQRALAQELERLRGQGNMPGAGEMAGEAQDIAKRMEAGRLDRETVARQEKLFRRMLDAGRTLQGEEKDEQKERQSTSATGDSVRLPPALRAQLSDDAGRLRVPSWEELQQLSPAERRLVVDYFRRLAQ